MGSLRAAVTRADNTFLRERLEGAGSSLGVGVGGTEVIKKEKKKRQEGRGKREEGVRERRREPSRASSFPRSWERPRAAGKVGSLFRGPLGVSAARRGGLAPERPCRQLPQAGVDSAGAAAGPARACCARRGSRVSGWEWRSPRRAGSRAPRVPAQSRGAGRTASAPQGSAGPRAEDSHPRSPVVRLGLSRASDVAAPRLQGERGARGAPVRPRRGVALGRRSLGGGARRPGAPRAGPLPPLVRPPRAASAPRPGRPPPGPPASPPASPPAAPCAGPAAEPGPPARPVRDGAPGRLSRRSARSPRRGKELVPRGRARMEVSGGRDPGGDGAGGSAPPDPLAHGAAAPNSGPCTAARESERQLRLRLCVLNEILGTERDYVGTLRFLQSVSVAPGGSRGQSPLRPPALLRRSAGVGVGSGVGPHNLWPRSPGRGSRGSPQRHPAGRAEPLG